MQLRRWVVSSTAVAVVTVVSAAFLWPAKSRTTVDTSANREVMLSTGIGAVDLAYQPNWLSALTVEQDGQVQQLFRNTGYKMADPGQHVTTRVFVPASGVDFGITIDDPARRIVRVIVEVENASGRMERYTLSDKMPPPPDPPECKSCGK